MARTLILVLFIGTFVGTQGGNTIDSEESSRHLDAYGIKLSAEVYEAVCWLEYLKTYLPTTRGENFNRCHTQGFFQSRAVLSEGTDEKYFGHVLLNYAMPYLPPEYMECSRYLLEDRYKKPETNYSKVLNDTKVGSVYPYQAFTHCMVHIVHNKFNSSGIRHINEKLTKEIDFKDTMLERENELRQLHGTKPLKMNDELTDRAQKWAEQLAKDCQMYHIYSSHPDFFLNGSRQGENLFTGDHVLSPKDDVSLLAISIWYEEIKEYPWPEYRGYGHDSLFPRIAHFSQLIWKESREVGYGYAANRNENCSRYFVVARYFPPGNTYDTFGENVPPPLSTK